MQALINKLSSFVHRAPKSDAVGGLFIGRSSIYFVLFNKDQDSAISYEKVDGIDLTNIAEKLTSLLKRFSAQKCILHVSIGTHYELVTIDKPDVDEDSVASAIKYSAKDILNGELDELVVDYFDIPDQPVGQNKANVVACKKDLVLAILAAAKSAHMHVCQIDIEELCYKNAFTGIDDPIMVLSLQRGQELSLQIHKQGKLYLHRRLRGYRQLPEATEEDVQTVFADNLSLEIQRSLDYFESQLKQAPVKRIYISIPSVYEKQLVAAVSVNFTIPILDLRAWLRTQLPEATTDNGFLTATCAALKLLEVKVN